MEENNGYLLLGSVWGKWIYKHTQKKEKIKKVVLTMCGT